jgi:deazaflavin-dependent oxidoreductase (nitroreductase family)
MSRPGFTDFPTEIDALISAHIALYKSDPEAAHMWDARPVGLPGLVPTLLLAVAGRKTGKVRHVTLLYEPDGDDFLVIGSKGGNADHPVWFLNLMAAGVCEIRVASLHARARAEVLEGAEHAAAWARIAGKYPVYAKYQARSERTIPVVRLRVVELLTPKSPGQ